MQSYSLPGAPNSCRLPDDRHPAPNADIPKKERRFDCHTSAPYSPLRPTSSGLRRSTGSGSGSGIPDRRTVRPRPQPASPPRTRHRKAPAHPRPEAYRSLWRSDGSRKNRPTRNRWKKRCQFYSYGTKARSSPYSGRRWVAGSSLSRHKSGSRPCWWNKHKTGPPGNSSTGTSELR